MAEDRHSAEEKGEYDYEGDMAKSQLKSIITNAQRMHDMLEETTNLPEWVQSKITLAEDYILTATSYMEGEMSEEYSIQERINMVKAKMGDVVKDFYKSDAPQFAGRSKEKRRQMAVAAKLGAMRKSKMSEELKGNQHKIDANKNNKIDAHDFKLLRSKLKVKKEEVELDEAVASNAEMAQRAHKAYIQATRQGNGTMAAQYAKDHQKYKKLAAIEKRKAVGEEVELDEAPYMGKGNHKPGWMLRADPKLAAKFKEIEDRKKRMKKNVGKTDDEIAKMRKEEVEQIDEASYMGKGNHKPGWMLRADPELARKFKEIEDRKKRMNSMMKKYGGKTGDEIAKMKKEEASPMIKPPSNRFDNKKDAFAHAKKNGGKVYRHEYINPRSGMKSTTFSVKEEVEQVDEVIGNTTGYSDSGPRNKADERKFHQMRNVVTKGSRTGKITKYAQNRLKARLKDKTYMDK